MKLAIFDFDGTITTKDSFIEFIIFAVGPINAVIGFIILSPILILHLIRILPNYKTKPIVLSYFFKGWDEGKFKARGIQFANQKIPNIVKNSALDKIREHNTKGDKVVVISASFESYIGEWGNSLGIETIATRAEFVDQKVTGKFATPNCYGAEKVVRLKEKYNLEDFEYIYAYGDSKGDKEIFDVADEVGYRSFV